MRDINATVYLDRVIEVVIGEGIPGSGGEGGSGNIDGGNAASVYTPSQTIDGGDA